MHLTSADCERILDEGVALGDVPGASLAVLSGETLCVAACGLANQAGAIAATVDTAFYIGSITKSLTATLVMQLIDHKKLSLDDNLWQLLPELQPNEEAGSWPVTIEQLLSHTSGIDGDRLIDTGEDDDYLLKFVEACQGIGLIHTPGQFFSYCNVGYIFLARIIEKITGQNFDDTLKARLLAPLGLNHSGTLIEDFADKPLALGHSRVLAGDGLRRQKFQPEPLWPRSNTPSGSRLAMTATDLVKFAQMHLRDGLAPDGQRLLSTTSVKSMQSSAVAGPPGARYRAWGLGWMIFGTQNLPVFGHDGGVAGTTSFLRVLPRQNVIIALMANGPGYRPLAEHVLGALLREAADMEAFPVLPKASGDLDLELHRYAGEYRRHGLDVITRIDKGRLLLRAGGEYGDPDASWFEISPIDETLFKGRFPVGDTNIPIGFLDFDGQGRPGYLRIMERVYRRVKI